jgi:hydroxymethylpyrimidine pyrophosphatase-like HAD family hydrolase
VDDASVDALRLLRASGRRLVLVTGRELDDLFAMFAHCHLFERVVDENGALLYDPATKTSSLLAPAPPPELVAL